MTKFTVLKDLSLENKNNNTVAVGGHLNPTKLHCAVISPVTGSKIFGLSRRNSQGDRETHNGGDGGRGETHNSGVG